MSPREQVEALVQSATRKSALKDGAGCLMDLDRATTLDPKVEARGNLGIIRATCEMQAGKCDQGKRRYRLAVAAAAPQLTPEQLDQSTSSQASRFCIASQGTPLEKANRAAVAIIEAYHKHDARTCADQGRALQEALGRVAPVDESDKREWGSHMDKLKLAGECLARNGGDCTAARALYAAWADLYFATYVPTATPAAIAGTKKSFVCPAQTR
jgi:hypothetical protein